SYAMKKTVIILTIALLVVSVLGIVLFREWRSTKKELNTISEQYAAAIQQNDAAPLVIRDTIVDTVSNSISYTYNPIQTTGPVEGYVSKGLADTLATALKVATNKIDRLTAKIISIEGAGKGDRITDTIRKTEWLVLTDPVFDVKVDLGTDSIFPSAKIGLAQAYAPYRKNIFSRYEYRSVIRASDARVQISDVYDVNKVPRSPRWGIGVTAGPVITSTGITMGAALGLTYDIIQF